MFSFSVFLFIGANSLLAIDDFALYIGRHDHAIGLDPPSSCPIGNVLGNNLVLEFTLDRGVVGGESGTLELHFDKDGVDYNIDGHIFEGINNDGLGVFLYNQNGGSPVWHDLSLAGYTVTTDVLRSTLDITWDAGMANDLTAGDVVNIYLGFSDDDAMLDPDDCVDGFTGKYSEASLPFNPSIENYMYFHPIGYHYWLTVDLTINYGGGEIEKGSSAVALNAKPLRGPEYSKITAINATSLSMDITGLPISISDMDHTHVGYNDNLIIRVQTNSSNGYSFRYRSTDFASESGTNTIPPLLTSSTIAAGDNKWGINIAENTSWGAYPVTIPGGIYRNSDYEIANYYKANVSSSYEVLTSSNDFHDVTHTISIVATPDELGVSGKYNAILYFVVYSNF